MIVYYENMNGEKLNLLKAPFRTTKTDWFDADWSESSDGYEKTVTIDVFGKREEFQANMEQLYRIDLCTTDMNGIQYCEKRNEICFMESEYIHKPEHAENEEWKLLWSVRDE